MLQKCQVAIQPIPFNGNFWSCGNDETNFNVYETNHRGSATRTNKLDLDSRFITYLVIFKFSVLLSSISTTLKSLFKRSDKKEVNLRHGVLSFKLFWNPRFQTCLVWRYVQTTLYWYFNLPRKLLCLFSEMYLTLPEYSLLNYLY